MSDNSNEQSEREDAVFIGWQENLHGGMIALYNITTAGHPLYGSTVTANGLQKLNLAVPEPPSV